MSRTSSTFAGGSRTTSPRCWPRSTRPWSGPSQHFARPPSGWWGSGSEPPAPLFLGSSVRLAVLQPGFDLVALDLAGRAAGELRERHEHEVLRLLVARELGPTAGVEARARERLVLARDDRDRHFTPRRIGAADDHGVGHPRIGKQDALDLGLVDVLAAGLDHVLEPVHEIH